MDEKDFCDATSMWNCNIFGDEDCWVCQPRHVVESQTTILDYKQGAARGHKYKTFETPVGKLYVWEKIKPRPSSRTGDLFVVQDGDKTFSYFDDDLP
jgi:hypothetical protein